MSQVPVPVKREREEEVEDLSVRESNAVPDSLRKFQEVLDSKFPLQRVRDFYDDAKIKEVAKNQREEIYKEFMGRYLKFTGSSFIRLTTELENGLENILEDLLKKNKDFREGAESLLQETTCLEFKKTIELHLNSKPDMELGQLQKLLLDEKAKILLTFVEGEVRLNQITKLKEKLNGMQAGFVRKQRCILERSRSHSSTASSPLQLPSSSSVPEDLSMTPRRQCQSQARSIDLERPGPSTALAPSNLEDLSPVPAPSTSQGGSQDMQRNAMGGPGPSTSTASPSTSRPSTSSQAPASQSPSPARASASSSTGRTPPPPLTKAQEEAIADDPFEELKRSMSLKLTFITEAFPRIFSSDNVSPKVWRTGKSSFDRDISELRRCLQRNNNFIGTECKAHAKLVEILQITEELVNFVVVTPQNLIPEEDAAALAWAMGIDARETLSIPTEEGKLTPSEWGQELLMALKSQCGKRRKNWDSEGKIIQEQLKLELEGIEKDKVEKEKPDAKYEPELLLNRLRRIWEARQRAYGAAATSTSVGNVGNKRRRKM